MHEYTERHSWENRPEFKDEDYEELTPWTLKSQIFQAWEVMKTEGLKFVQLYKKQGKNGQKVFDQVLRSMYVGISVRLSDFPEYKAGAEKLLEDIERLTTYVQEYKWPYNFCLTCGDPLTQKDVWYCDKCRPSAIKRAERDRHEYGLPSSMTVKIKKGSASKHGHGHIVNKSVRPRDRKKGKGGKSAR